MMIYAYNICVLDGIVRYFWQLAEGTGLRYMAYMMPSFGFRYGTVRYGTVR
jgi:hypothetical protein